MTPITKVRPKFVSPKGYEEIVRGIATVDLGVADPVVIDASVTPDARYDCAIKKAASEAFFHGVVAKDAKAGQVVEVILQGEMDGFSGMTPGAPIYAEAGALGTTAPVYYTSATTPVVNVPAPPQVFAISATRIRIRI